MKQDIYEMLSAGKPATGRPFRVPDGYFDGLQQRVMDALPADVSRPAAAKPRRRAAKAVLRTLALPRWQAVAAGVCALVVGATAYLYNNKESAPAVATAQQVATTTSDSYIDQVADYTMMDNDDIYTYLSSNDY